MRAYWKCILAIHGPEIVERYGSVSMVDEGLVPVGVMGMMKQGKVRWRG